MKGKRNKMLVGIFFIQAFAGAVLNGDSVVTTVSSYCSAGYVVVKDTCVQCGIGTFRNNTTMSCEYCPVGFYQDVAAQSSCIKCADGKTTGTFGSNSSSDCIDECPPGYRRAAPTGCQICEKGYYQPMKSQESCITCGIQRTTETTGSTKLIQCINACPDGQQHNFYNDTCTNCDKGFYTYRQKTEKCIKCPNGQTTLYPGANQCIITTISTDAPPPSVSVPVKFVFTGRFDCSSPMDLENFRILVRGQIIVRLKFLAVKYQGLCSNVDCQNINSLVITISIGGCKPKATQGKRRREAADNQLQFDVQIPWVSSTLTNADVTLTTSSFLQEDMTINLEQYTPTGLQNILSPVSATVSSPIIECPNGSVYSNDMCVPCPAGTRYLVLTDGTKICDTCPLNTYQSSTGQSSCTPCVGEKKYTMAVGSQSSNDCVSICGKGFQFNHTINECNGCKLGYYKDVAGNSINCTACPVNKTTSYENSTSVNNCNIDDCPLGYHRASPTGCQICNKGYYQPMMSQESCISCGIKRTTETTGATKPIQCIYACPDGQQYNFYNKTCTNCDKGFYTDRQKTEKCIKCPTGQTTIYPGANQCIINTISTVAPPASVTVPVKFVYFGRFDCSSSMDLENFRILVRGQIILRLKILAVRYQGLCSNVYCQNINSLVIIIPIGGCKPKATQGKRRREVSDNELQFDVQIPEVSSTVTNAGVALMPTSLLQEDMAINLDQYTPPDLQNILIPVSATVSSPIIECSNGSVYNNDMCVPCPAGTRYLVSTDGTKTCDTCPLNTYQSLTGQSSCTQCIGVKNYTMDVGSQSSSNCVSECVKTPKYCNTGTCTEDQFSVFCTCPAGLQEDRCQNRDLPATDTYQGLIIGVSSGLGVVLIIVALVTVIKLCRSKEANDLNYDVATQPTTDYENHYLSIDNIVSANVSLHLPTTSSTNTFVGNDNEENNITCGNKSGRTSTHTYIELLVFDEENVHSTQHAYNNTIDTLDHIGKPVDTHDRTLDDSYDYID